MDRDRVIARLSGQPLSREEAMELLRTLSGLVGSGEETALARELCIRCLDQIALLPEDMRPVLRDILEQLGYFQYMNRVDDQWSMRSALDYEYHRSDFLPDIVMHAEQFSIAEKLLAGESVILSAPTSFGKSLLIEEIVASRRFRNIVVLQPTLALIDETRQKLVKYRDYKVVVSTAQALGERNVILVTPERLVEMEEMPCLDLFIIDEFYKLSPDRDDDERASVLNHAFYRLQQKTRHFFLLGPRIASIPRDFTSSFRSEFIRSNFTTVVSEVVQVEAPSKPKLRAAHLYELLHGLDEPTLIYCQAPSSAEKHATRFSAAFEGAEYTEKHEDVIKWVSGNIHPDWSLISCLRKGVGFHHGKLPRHLAKYLVQAFNEGSIQYLFCTSTLIEGVNTAAKNVVVYDPRKGTRDLDFFDFTNISGRSGRMGKHLIGRVYTYVHPPDTDDLEVDFPWFTQDKAPLEVLVQIDGRDLRSDARKRLDFLESNDYLPVTVIRRNANVTPEGQVELAKVLHHRARELNAHLRWREFPSWDQLLTSCNLIWDHLVVNKEADRFVRNGRQLAGVVYGYAKHRGVPSPMIRQTMNRRKCSADDAIQQVMGQTRTWCEFRFPKLLLALNSIQEYVFSARGLPIGNYQPYATVIECGFVPPSLAALREFGIPIQVAKKLTRMFSDDVSLDHVVERIRSLDLEAMGLDAYERRLLRDV